MTIRPDQPSENLPESHQSMSQAGWPAMLTEIGRAAYGLVQQIDQFLKANPDFLNNLARFVTEFPTAMRSAWVRAAEQGWYLPPSAPASVVGAANEGGPTLDAYMTELMDEGWDQMTVKVMGLYPERAPILQVAFDLHRAGNYIASIPLFLAQSDGICAQELNAFLFSEHDRRADVIAQRLVESGDDVTGMLLDLFTLKTQIGASISNATQAKKANGPNRNGILHGSRRHLDYGTRINGYKAYCLLCFVALCFDRENKRRDDGAFLHQSTSL